MTTCTHTLFNPLKRAIFPSNLVWETAAAEDDLGLVTRRVIRTIEPKSESAIEVIKGFAWDKAPENFPEWDMIEERFPQIRALPGSAHAFRYLLKNAEAFRRATAEWWPNLVSVPQVLEIKVYGMCSFLAQKALGELEGYEQKIESAFRPADTYRAYGLALRYATEELGSFTAREALAALMLATPLPVDELENPDWIDPYTSEKDGDYTYLKVREAEVSSDGNTMIADLLENLGEDAAAFEDALKAHGSSLDDYWRDFLEAQRSGFSNLPEPEEEQEEPEFDVIEKDFQFSQDLKIDFDAVAKIQEAIGSEYITRTREAVNQIAMEAQAARVARQKFDFNAAHARFLAGYYPKAFLREAQKCARSFSPADLLAAILPFQNAFGFWEEDLHRVKLPHGRISLAQWYAIHGEEYLEQFVREDVDYGDPAVNRKIGSRFIPQSEPGLRELDEFVWKVVFEQAELYNEGEKRRISWAERIGLKYRPDAKWHPAFVQAEVQTAVMGDGGSQSAQAAGWDAWRDAVDPEANRAYKCERRHGASHAQAMEKFWTVVRRSRGRIASMNKSGVTLKSGRKIDWGITLLKLKANEIPMEPGDFGKMLDLLQRFSMGTAALRVYLRERIEREAVKQP